MHAEDFERVWKMHKFPTLNVSRISLSSIMAFTDKRCIAACWNNSPKNSIVSGWVTTCILEWCHTRVSCRCRERKVLLVLSKHTHSLIIHSLIGWCDSVKWYKTSETWVLRILYRSMLKIKTWAIAGNNAKHVRDVKKRAKHKKEMLSGKKGEGGVNVKVHTMRENVKRERRWRKTSKTKRKCGVMTRKKALVILKVFFFQLTCSLLNLWI